MASNAFSHDSDRENGLPMEEVDEGLVKINDGDLDSHLWGYLDPIRNSDCRIDFWTVKPCYRFGRGNLNDFCFPHSQISTNHCIITWDGNRIAGSVTVKDLSLHGTFKNGQEIGKNQVCILNNGDELAFPAQTGNTESEAHRYIFRQILPVLTKGFYSEYDLAENLGSGAFGVVRKAVHRASGECFAVKMIDATKANQRQTERLVSEIKIQRSLVHRNVCQLREYFKPVEGDCYTYIVLEYVNGGDLKDYTTENYRGGIPEDQVKDIVAQICDGMAYIHSRSITHRDLKPENILLTRTVPPEVKIADFGLSKAVHRKTSLRTMCGSMKYVAPEVVNNSRYSNRVDSFSLGCIIFFMLTGTNVHIENIRMLQVLKVDTKDMRHRVNMRQSNLDDMNVDRISQNARDLIKDKLLTKVAHKRYSMVDIITCSRWLQGFKPHYGWSIWFETTVKPQTPHSKARAKVESPGRIRSRAPVSRGVLMNALPEESSFSIVTGGGIDTEMMPATPLRRVLRGHHAMGAKPSADTLRHNMRRRAHLESRGKK